MDNLTPANIQPDELPDGFTAASSVAGGRNNNNADSLSNERELQREALLEAALTPEALERLKRIKLVKAEKASHVESTIVSMFSQGKLSEPINEGKLIEMIERMSAAGSGSGTGMNSCASGKINIQRKRNTLLDSDDDMDNDDDLF
jgi:programmed cell death protein 5